MTKGGKRLRVLFLGGAHTQVPVIEEAKSRGYYIITCDYLPTNPGHRLADEYYNVSTTDMERVLRLAESIKPDFIVAYASDPAAPVAAYVSERLGLPGNSYSSICNLAEKDLFRKLQRDNGFNAPRFVSLGPDEDPVEKTRELSYPFVIKPTDSSGSKGITKITSPSEIAGAARYARTFSRNKRLIAEEYVDNTLADLHGDGFVVDGKLVFSCLGDHIYNNGSNPYNPVGTLWPSRHKAEIIARIESDVASIIKSSGFLNGPVNIEARLNSEGLPFVMEIGPRSGGHFVPQAIKHATGFDMVKAHLDLLNGQKISVKPHTVRRVGYYAIHSDYSGKLDSISFDDTLSTYIREFHQYVLHGERVKPFMGANAAIGILVLCFDSRKNMEEIFKNIDKLVTVQLMT